LRIAYISGGNLWVVEEGISPRQLTTTGVDSAPLLSPNGQRVLFERDLAPGPGDVSRFELHVINVDGSGERPVAGPDDLPGEMGTPVGSETETMLPRLPWQVAWHPDSQRVAFNTLIQVGYGLYAKHDLWTADPNAGLVTRLLDDDAGGAFAFAPDGNTVVVADPTTVARANGDGSNRQELFTFEFVNTASEYAYVPQPVWAPDSSHALIAISSAEPFGPNPSGNIWRIPHTGDAAQLATLSGRFLFSTMGENNLWSPDRSRFAYTSVDGDLILANGDGSDRSVYASGGVEFVAWSPDNRHFIYRQGSPWTYYVGEMGTDPVPLLPPDLLLQVRSAEWVALDTFVYSSGTGETMDIRLGEVAGPHQVLVTGVQMFDVAARP
jgi:Tol biopolymer transport system component